VAKALAPARVREVVVDDDDQQATVIVPDDQLSLAIGREGQNARLAARLTGWRIDIRSETEYAHEDSTSRAPRDGRPLSRHAGDRRAQPPRLLKEGKVSINGIVVRRPERLVGSEDVVVVDGDTV
jgi:predicted PilT family ATPase